MGADTKIEWCDHTFNPWIGCTQVSPGCLNCYAMMLMAIRYGRVQWGPGKARARTSKTYWRQPLRWNRLAEERLAAHNRELATSFGHLSEMMEEPQRPRVFCASLADWLDNDHVPIEWLVQLLALIEATPHLDWLLLTKRPQNWEARLVAATRWAHEYGTNASAIASWVRGTPPVNVWIGVSVEDQTRANERIPELLKIPARIRFLSCEPLLGPVELEPVWIGDYQSCEGYYPRQLHWAIIGGESGPGARDFDVEAGWDLARQCESAGVATFVKQLGARPVTGNANVLDWPDDTVFIGHGTGAASARVKLRDAKGGDIDEFPAELRVRQFPEVAA